MPPRKTSPALARDDARTARWPRGLHVDREGNVWVTDAVAADPIDARIAHARRVFVRVLHKSVPEVFEQLRVRVYPKFARYARVAPRPPNLALDTHQPESGKTGADDEMSIAEHERLYGGVSRAPPITSRGQRRVKPLLLAWAKDYGCAREAWILEGALRVLLAWKQWPAWRQKLDVSCFCLPVAEDTIIERFSFQDVEGWSPQFETAASYLARVTAQVKEALTAHIQSVLAKVERQGAHDVQHRFPIESFKLFALVQFGGQAAGDLARLRGMTKGAVLKRLNLAAQALGWSSALRHDRRGRPRRTPAVIVSAEVRTYRAALKRELQQAGRESGGDYLHQVEVKAIVTRELPQLGAADLSQLLAGGLKPSAVAARVTAKKFGLPLRHVRTGRVVSERNRTQRRWEGRRPTKQQPQTAVEQAEARNARKANQRRAYRP